MIRLIGVFLLGVYVGQEYKNIPSITKNTNNIYTLLKKTEIYNILSRDYKKVVDDEKKNNKWF
jgi:hypothetical protein